MVAINTKYPLVRRVLISYLFKHTNKDGVTNYYGTKFLDADPYFYSASATHRYIFKNRYYKLEVANNAFVKEYPNDLYKKRRYHNVIPGFEKEFVADTKEKAIRRFKARKEFR